MISSENVNRVSSGWACERFPENESDERRSR